MKFSFLLAQSLIAIFLAPLCLAEDTNYEQIYASGVKLYQEKKFKEASEMFQDVLKSQPLNKYALLNLGLAEYHQEHFSLAAAAWRRASYYFPTYQPVKNGLQLLHEKVGRFQNNTGVYSTIKTLILDKVTINQLFGTSLILFLCGGYLLVIYIAQRRRSLLQDLPLPQTPIVSAVFATLFLIAISLSFSKTYDYSINKATIITSDTAVRSGPSPEEDVIFTLQESVEVIVHRTVDNWAQVTYPGGLSGWVPNESLFLTSGPLL